MADIPTPPIITDEHGDIEFHPSLMAAARELEAIDVANHEYEIFDSIGRRISASVVHGEVFLIVDQSSPADSDLLAERLREFISRLGPSRVGLTANLSELTLEALVQALSGFFRG